MNIDIERQFHFTRGRSVKYAYFNLCQNAIRVSLPTFMNIISALDKSLGLRENMKIFLHLISLIVY